MMLGIVVYSSIAPASLFQNVDRKGEILSEIDRYTCDISRSFRENAGDFQTFSVMNLTPICLLLKALSRFASSFCERFCFYTQGLKKLTL